jgi:hypothetical protein
MEAGGLEPVQKSVSKSVYERSLGFNLRLWTPTGRIPQPQSVWLSSTVAGLEMSKNRGQSPILYSFTPHSVAIDTQELVPQIALGINRRMYPMCLASKIRIQRTDNDARMIWMITVQADKMLTVESQQYA